MSSLTAEPTLTWILIGINVLAGIGSLSGAQVGDRGTLTDAGELSRGTIANGDFWTLLTSGFLHAGLFHLFSNMLALWILGTLLEPCSWDTCASGSSTSWRCSAARSAC